MVLCLIRNAFSSSKEQNYTSWGMLLRLKSCAVMPQKLCGCKGKVKRLRRKRWQRITKRQNKKPLRNIVLKDFPLFIFTLKSLFYFLKNILLRCDLIPFELPFYSFRVAISFSSKNSGILFEIN